VRMTLSVLSQFFLELSFHAVKSEKSRRRGVSDVLFQLGDGLTLQSEYDCLSP
jgi:hypothetical protein